MANYGFFLLFLCCICCSYGFIASVCAAKLRHRRLFQSARIAATASAVLAIIAAIIMWIALYDRDFSIYYILKNSSTDLPALYTFTAFWSSLEGSHFLWTMFLNIVTAICLWFYAKDNEHIMPYVAASLLIILSWMFYLSISHSDFFALSPMAAPEGRGMNTLLQNVYMAIHPPMLFIGYTTLAVPFAYSIAALCYGDVTEGWLKTTRRWTLVAFSFLGAAIILGGRWAYVELGWAGYWAWDPVENSSLMPWIMATALLHCLLIQGQLGQLKRLTFIIAILAFFLTFFGTFITRSGIITSVHSFAESPIGPNYLAFLAVLLLVCSLIYGFRAHLVLPSETDKIWGVSRESSLALALVLFLSFGAIVFVGTVFPIVSEALTKQRISIQAPYFNSFAPYIGLCLLILMGMGNIMRYQSSKLPGGNTLLIGSAALAIPLAALAIYLGDIWATEIAKARYIQVIGVYLLAWCFNCLTWDLGLRLKDLRWNWSIILKRNRAYFGGYIAHVGMLLMIFGFLGNYRGLEQEVSLKANQSKSVLGYDFTFKKGFIERREGNAMLLEVPITVTRNGQHIADMLPAKSRYPTSNNLLNEIAVSGNMWRDIYLVIKDFKKEPEHRAVIKVNINPTVRFVWLATFILTLGGLISLSDPYRGDRTRDAVAGKWELNS